VQEIFLSLMKLFLMVQKIKEKRSIGDQIKDHFIKNQSWLAEQIGMSEAQLSRKIKGTKEWTQDDLDKINKVLNTDFKL
jgi:plasmid maintenance system antidote protein VapI